MMKKVLLIATMVACVMISCKSSSVLTNKSYALTELNGFKLKPVEGRKAPQIKFTDKLMSATVGCNMINATYTVKPDGTITFGMGAMTKMYCPDALREDEFVEAIDKVVRYQASPDGKYVNFLDKDGKILFRGKMEE
ncbi:MAG: META domain-containing protein [Sodaliphilus sp.]